jgi:Flp pilus assembly protein protease CpaA
MLTAVLSAGIASVILAHVLPRITLLSQPPELPVGHIVLASAGSMLWVALAMSVSSSAPGPELVCTAVLAMLSAAYDVRARVIPNRLLVCIVVIYAVTVVTTVPQALPRVGTAGLVTAAAMFGLLLISRGGFGAGDAKLIAALGLILGAKPAIAACGVAFIASLAPSLFYVLTGRRSHKFAFGPYIAVGSFLASIAWSYL